MTAPYSPEASCRLCSWPVVITGTTTDQRAAAVAEWRACDECRTSLPTLPTASDWHAPAGLAFAAVMVLTVALWLALIAWLITRT